MSTNDTRPDADKPDYEVGYGRPPKQYRFRKGQSGNSLGRAKGHKNLRTHLAEELDEKISITENGQPKIISKGRGMVKALTAKAMKGDVRAIATALGLVERLLLPAEAADKATPLAEADEMIFALYAPKNNSKDQR